MNKLLQTVAIIGIAVGAFFFQMFTFLKLWSWVAVPAGAPQIGLNTAFGISLMITLFHPYPSKHEQEGTELALSKLVFSLASSAITLFVGYLLFG